MNAGRRLSTLLTGFVPPSPCQGSSSINSLGALPAAARRWLQSSATWSNKNADDVAEEIVEKGSKKLMSTDDGRAELRDGSFNLDKTAKRIMEEGQQAIQAEGGDSQAAAQAQEGAEKVDTKEQPEVAERVKERVISMSQTS